mgnify:CR=1 FL=1|jgi:hypothetical protein
MNIFADLVYFILKSNQIKTFYLLFRCEKTPKINFLFVFCSVMSMERVVISLYPFHIF